VALSDSLRSVGLQIWAGLHTGEVEVIDKDITGIGVHIASRVLEASTPGECWFRPEFPCSSQVPASNSEIKVDTS
jgi:class 3 adenylate cyclase